MRYLFQFARLLAFCCAGELLHAFLPLPIPASVYGLLLLLAALCTGIVKLEQVQTTGIFLTGIFRFSLSLPQRELWICGQNLGPCFCPPSLPSSL